MRSSRRRRCRRSRALASCSTNSRAATPSWPSRIVTTSPDVTVSTNLGAWVNRRGLFAQGGKCRSVPAGEDPLDLQLGFFAEGPAPRTRHRRDEPVHPAVGAGTVACDQRRAAAADRHAVRSLHPARPRCAELRLLPGCALHGGGDAVRHHAGAGRRRASVDRDAADRHGAGWAGLVRAGLRRRTRRHHGLGFRPYAARRRRGRLGLSAAVDPHARAAAADHDAGAAKRHHRRRLLAAQARARMRSW